MVELPVSTLKQDLYAWHKWVGLSVLMIVIARLIWRMLSRAPEAKPNSAVPAFIHLLSKLGHLALYALLIGLPLIGWLRSSTAGFQIVLFEIIPVPDLLSKNIPLSELLEQMHAIGAWALAALLAGHIGAVLIHHKVWQDPVLEKMRPSTGHLAILAIVITGGAAFVINATLINPPKPGEQSVKQKPINNEKPQSKTSSLWEIEPQTSKLEFKATQKGAATTGAFEEITIKKLKFSNQTPEQALVEIEISIASVSLGNKLIEETLLSNAWFNQQAYPTAIFKAKGFTPKGGEEYLLNGTLTMKGVSKPQQVTLMINKTIDQNTGKQQIKATGKTIISRLSFGIGEGEWANTETLADEIELKINITALKNNAATKQQ